MSDKEGSLARSSFSDIPWGLRMGDKINGCFRSLIDKAITVMLYISMAVLALMMYLTAADVFLRYAFNKPIAGASELTEFMMAIFVPFSILYCAKQKSHITVDLLMERFPTKVQTVTDVVTALITIVFFGLMTWQNIFYVMEEFESKLTSAVLLIPSYPFVVPVAIMAGLLCVVLATQILHTLKEALKK